MSDSRDFDDELQVWEREEAAKPGHLGFKAACLKKGPKAFKSVRVSKFGDPATGELKHTELRFAKNERLADGRFDFDNPSETFRIENDEIDLLAAFLNNPDVAAGCYRLVEEGSPTATLVARLRDGQIGPEELAQILDAVGSVQAMADALGSIESGITAAEAAVLAARRAKIAELQALCADAATTETDLQQAIGDAYWLFGGNYAGVLDRRNLALLDELDVPLVCSDGTVHAVELKGAVIGNLVVDHRNHLIVGKPVHEAVGQAMNYIRSLDEQGPQVERALRDIGIEVGTRRVFATVVIGHPSHVAAHDESKVEETIRTYNSHLSRIQVVTYKSLLDAAARALDFGTGA